MNENNQVQFGMVVRPKWEHAEDAAAYPTAVVTGSICPVQNSGNVRFAVILLPATPESEPMEWRCYLDEVTLTGETMTLDEVSDLCIRIRERYGRMGL